MMTTYPTWAETPEGRWPQILEQARMSESDEAVKILGRAGFKVRRLTRRMYAIERECSTEQLAKLAANVANGLDDVSRGANGKA